MGYLDAGAHPAKDPPAATSIPPGDRSVRIGAYSDTTPAQLMNGALDDLRIYDRALSAAEIALFARNGPTLRGRETRRRRGMEYHRVFGGER